MFGQRVGYGLEVFASGIDPVAVSVGFHVLCARKDRRFHDFVFGTHAERIFDLANLIETERDRARFAEIAAVLRKRCAHIGGRAVLVVG